MPRRLGPISTAQADGSLVCLCARLHVRSSRESGLCGLLHIREQRALFGLLHSTAEEEGWIARFSARSPRSRCRARTRRRRRPILRRRRRSVAPLLLMLVWPRHLTPLLQFLLQHNNMSYPTTAAQLTHMTQQLRRMGHMIER